MTNIICARCKSPVVFEAVTPGYFAVCPEHDEDLYEFETRAVDKLPKRIELAEVV